MDRLSGIERQRTPNNLPLRKKAGMFISRLGLVAMCAIPAVDLAFSDIVSAKVLQVSQDTIISPDFINPKSEVASRAAEMGIVAADLMIESMAVGMFLSKRKRLNNVFNDYGEYRKERLKKMHPVWRFLGKMADLPYVGLEKIGNGVEWLGEKVAARKSKVARAAGKLLIDTAQVNIIGTNGVVMRETMAGNPPSLKRNFELASLITFSWIGLAEGIRWVYRNVDALRPGMATIGETFTELTSPDVTNPLNTPTATAVVGGILLGFAAKGWDIAKFHEQRQPVDATPVA